MPFGHFSVKLSTRRISPTAKIWGLLFICETTRAVHIELISSLFTKDFLSSFDRFTSRRGIPALLRSDSAGNFTAGAKYITEWAKFLLDQQTDILSALTTRNVKFSKIPPYTPWLGSWEPLVKVAKNLLKF